MLDLPIRNCDKEAERALCIRAAQNGRNRQMEALGEKLGRAHSRERRKRRWDGVRASHASFPAFEHGGVPILIHVVDSGKRELSASALNRSILPKKCARMARCVYLV